MSGSILKAFFGLGVMVLSAVLLAVSLAVALGFTLLVFFLPNGIVPVLAFGAWFFVLLSALGTVYGAVLAIKNENVLTRFAMGLLGLFFVFDAIALVVYTGGLGIIIALVEFAFGSMLVGYGFRVRQLSGFSRAVVMLAHKVPG